MKNKSKYIIPLIIFGFFVNLSGLSLASDALDSFTFIPFRYITVKGDAAKFRALNWMNDGYTGGIKEMSLSKSLSKDLDVSFEGHAIPGDNDYGTDLTLTKKEKGYLRLDYGNFRKYYDVYGASFAGYTTVQSVGRLNADPKLDLGHFLFEIGSGTQMEPGVSFSYERKTKDGIKNSLTWGKIVQGATTKYINPSWEQIALVNDEIKLKANTEIAGFGFSATQKVGFLGGSIYREENAVSPLDASAYYQKQTKDPQSVQLLSSLKADKWIVDDKSYISFGYQYQHLKNTESELLKSIKYSDGTLGGGRNRNNEAQTTYDSHTWVQQYVQNFTKSFNAILKLKEELIERNGSSLAQTYNSSGNITSQTPSIMENQTTKMGESVSLRYTGISKTTLYADLDLLQKRHWISDWRSTSYINAIDKGPEGSGTVGFRYVPISKVNLTSNLRHEKIHNNYNTLFNSDAGWNIARLHADSNQLSNKVAYKPFKWLENSLRLQFIDTYYHTQTLAQTGGGWVATNFDWLKSQVNQKVYTYNIVIQPTDQWMFDLAYSMNNFKVSTPASQYAVSSGGIPNFRGDVYTWMATTSFAPTEKLSLYSSFEYSRAKNFDSYDYAGIPLGVDNRRYDTTVGVKYSLKDNIIIEPHYGYYSYRAYQSSDYGSYSAHVFWLDTKFTW